MTNFEHILTDKNLANLRETAMRMGLRAHAGIEAETGRVIFCDSRNCESCRFHGGDDCVKGMAEWLDEEYQEPLPFPIGTVIEVNNYWDNLLVCYYNGVKDGIHVGVYDKRNVGTAKGFTINIDTARKVGE